MFRTARIAASTGTLVLCILLAVLNVHPVSTVLAVVLAVLALHILIVSSEGFYTAYMEELHSDLRGKIASVENLFTKAEKSMHLLVGELGPIIYFNKKIFSACRDAIKRGVGVKIILAEPDANLEGVKHKIDKQLWEEFAGWVHEDKVSIQRTTRRVSPHFIIVDDTHLWLEDAHAKRRRQGVNGVPRSRTIYFSEEAPYYTNLFARFADQSPSLPVA